MSRYCTICVLIHSYLHHKSSSY